jgi:hypothetical protein
MYSLALIILKMSNVHILRIFPVNFHYYRTIKTNSVQNFKLLCTTRYISSIPNPKIIGTYGFSTSIIETKLPMSDHWKVLYKVCVFYADRKSKMATTAGHRLTLDPMITHGQFGFNYRSGFREETF